MSNPKLTQEMRIQRRGRRNSLLGNDFTMTNLNNAELQGRGRAEQSFTRTIGNPNARFRIYRERNLNVLIDSTGVTNSTYSRNVRITRRRR